MTMSRWINRLVRLTVFDRLSNPSNPHLAAGIVREYVFYVFLNPEKRDFLRFLKCHVKIRKNVESTAVELTR